MQIALDDYSTQARLGPMLTVLFPFLLWAASLFPSTELGWGLVTALVGFGGASALLAQLGRDLGLKAQDRLFEAWGGPPTTLHLRLQSSPMDKGVLADIHQNLSKLTGAPAPTPEQEAADPGSADALYRRWTNFLRERTRDAERFPLVHAENINFGVRRNLYGLRPVGLYVALWSLVFISLDSIVWTKGQEGMTSFHKLALFMDVFFAYFWWKVVKPDWVKPVAIAYARRLLGASHQLVADQEAKQ